MHHVGGINDEEGSSWADCEDGDCEFVDMMDRVGSHFTHIIPGQATDLLLLVG